MFNKGDLVLCIQTEDPLHVMKPTLGKIYTIQKYEIWSKGWNTEVILPDTKDYRDNYYYAAKCFIRLDGLTKLERLIYGLKDKE
jgi:hypothetical protein